MQNEKNHKRARYAAEFKEKVAWEALTGAKTHAQSELLGLSRSSTYYKTRAAKDDPVTERAIETLYEEDATLQLKLSVFFIAFNK